MMISILLSFIPNIWEFITLLLLMFESILFGYLFVYHPKLRWSKIEAFNMFPFSCQKCFTFWCNLIQNILLAYIWNWHFVIWGLITALTLAYMIWYSWERK